MNMKEFKTVIENETGNKFNRNNKMLCPLHDDEEPSFCIYEEEKPKFKCFGCGKQGDIIDFIQFYRNMNFIEACEYLESMGYRIDNVDYSNVKSIISYFDKKGFKIIGNEIYPFKDHKGRTKYYKIKFKTDTGKITPYYSIIDGKIVPERVGEELPYNLYKLVKSKYHTVYITEGEKDADTLTKMGFLTVSLKNFKYNKFYSRFFKNKNIIVIPDNDEAGEKYKNEVIRGLKPYVKSYKVFPIDKYSNEKGQDITDLLELKLMDKQKFKEVLEEEKTTYTYINGGKIIPIKLAKLILNCEYIIYSRKEGFFHYEDGYYKLKDDRNDTMMKKVISDYIGDTPLNTTRNKTEVLNQLKELAGVEEIELDDNNYLNFKNGLLKVTENGYKFIEHTPEIVTINRLNYNYRRTSYTDKLYYNGLKYALYDDMELVRFLQQFAGSLLIPSARLMKKALYITGARGTAKSTFIEPLQAMLGEGLYSACSLDELEGNKWILSSLIDKKAILSTESSGRNLENCERLKKLIYGESLYTDKKWGDSINDLKLNLSIIIASNTLPKFRDSSDAIFDRLEFIRFERVIRGTEKEDPLFIEKIITNENEMLGVINFALDGLVQLKRNSYQLNIREKVRELKKEVMASNSPFNGWFYTCTTEESRAFTKWSDLWNSYLGYCLSEHDLDRHEARKECGKQEMKKILIDRGYKFIEDTNRDGKRAKNIFDGIRLNEKGLQYTLPQ